MPEPLPLEPLKLETPKVEAPKTTKTPKSETPKTETPKTATPKTEAPKTEAPKAAALDMGYVEPLFRKHRDAPCVKTLIGDLTRMKQPRFLAERQSEIRACGAQVGFKKG